MSARKKCHRCSWQGPSGAMQIVQNSEGINIRICPHCAAKQQRPKKQNASRAQWFERKRAEREEYAHRWT